MTTTLLGIYLNDHLAGATAGAELAKRLTGAQRSGPAGSTLAQVADELAQVADEIAQDRQALLEIMTALDVPVRQYKVAAGWVAEKLGRLKLNGHLVDRSPLSDVLELEGLRLGVEGKRALWRTLRSLADSEPRLQGMRLDELVAGAERQIEKLEQLRIDVGTKVFTSG